MYNKELAELESEVAAHSIPESDAKDAAAAVAKADVDLTKYMTAAYQRLRDAFNAGKESLAYDVDASTYQNRWIRSRRMQPKRRGEALARHFPDLLLD